MTDYMTKWRNGLRRRMYAPAIEVRPLPGLLRLGSHDCGLTLEPSPDLRGATLITAGLGEDASFDVELASMFGAKVIVVDPTPRSIKYFERLETQIGQNRSQPYVVHGVQPIQSYDLTALKKGDLILEASALWCENTTLRFYAPPNPEFVSHSIANIQSNYSRDTAYIEVPALTPEALVSKYSLLNIPLLKLDIEGAEFEVIPHMFKHRIFPRQVLIEYDEMLYPSRRSKMKTETTHRTLVQAGYSARHYEGFGNYLYIRQ